MIIRWLKNQWKFVGVFLLLFFLVSNPVTKNLFWKFIGTISGLSKEQGQLATENTNLVKEAEQIRQQLMGEERKDLVKLLTSTRKWGWSFEPALVIARADPYRQLYFINKGKSQGLAIGQAVINSAGFVLGKVDHVWDEVATILLLVDDNSRLAVHILEDNDRTPYLLAGDRGLTLRLKLVSLEAQIRTGMRVITGNLEPMIPSGIPVGNIFSVAPTDLEGVFQEIVVQAPVANKYLRVVGVLIPSWPPF